MSNTFLDPTQCSFRYINIVYNKEQIAYHIWDLGYLSWSSKYQTSKPKKRYNNVYDIAIFFCIVLADKGYIVDYKVTVSAIAKIHG